MSNPFSASIEVIMWCFPVFCWCGIFHWSIFVCWTILAFQEYIHRWLLLCEEWKLTKINCNHHTSFPLDVASLQQTPVPKDISVSARALLSRWEETVLVLPTLPPCQNPSADNVFKSTLKCFWQLQNLINDWLFNDMKELFIVCLGVIILSGYVLEKYLYLLEIHSEIFTNETIKYLKFASKWSWRQ